MCGIDSKWMATSSIAGNELTWDIDGNVYVVTEFQSIEKYDPKLKRVWRQSALRDPRGNMAYSITLLSSGRSLVIGTDINGRNPAVMHFVDRDGNISKSSYATALVEAYEPSVQPGPEGPSIAGSTSYGDFLMLRIRTDPLRVSILKLLREDYAFLGAESIAVDPSGNIYAEMWAGGRKPSEKRRILCRFPIEEAASCVAIARTPELAEHYETPGLSIAAKDGGLLFLRWDNQLVRIDFPEPSRRSS